MQSWADRQEADLKALFPSWDIWHVRSVFPKPSETWHARPRGSPIATINAETPEDLVAAIADAEAATP